MGSQRAIFILLTVASVETSSSPISGDPLLVIVQDTRGALFAAADMHAAMRLTCVVTMN